MLVLNRAKEIFKAALERYKKSCYNKAGIIRGSIDDKSFFTGHCSRLWNSTIGSIFDFEVNFTMDSGNLGFQRANRFIREMDECQDTIELLLLTKKFNTGKNLPKALISCAIKIYYDENNARINALMHEKRVEFLKIYTPTGPYLALTKEEAEAMIYQEIIEKIELQAAQKECISPQNAQYAHNQL